MNQSDDLAALEKLLESFLERAVAAKEQRLQILGGLNRLDDIARTPDDGSEVVEDVGEWLADHSTWLESGGLRDGDRNRIGDMLKRIDATLAKRQDTSPAARKIRSEVKRWSERTTGTVKLHLRRGPEPAVESDGSMAAFGRLLERLAGRYRDMVGSRKHLFSVLDESLKTATIQKNKEALLLSAFIIYSLKLDDYKVGPYVKRLKEAEALVAGRNRHA